MNIIIVIIMRLRRKGPRYHNCKKTLDNDDNLMSYFIHKDTYTALLHTTVHTHNLISDREHQSASTHLVSPVIHSRTFICFLKKRVLYGKFDSEENTRTNLLFYAFWELRILDGNVRNFFFLFLYTWLVVLYVLSILSGP